jgi:O-acetyl-ADP-ribose deacetylase (regulator of RNase III)
MAAIDVIEADIATLEVDAIVNAANETLLGGGGVDGAIHRAAGPELLAECKSLGGCPTGEAKLTAGYNLPAKYVIHTVGPVWRGGSVNEKTLLANCYQHSLEIARDNDVNEIAFPAISTGAYRFPGELAAEIATRTVAIFLKQSEPPKKVIFCCFGADSLKHHQIALANL